MMIWILKNEGETASELVSCRYSRSSMMLGFMWFLFILRTLLTVLIITLVLLEGGGETDRLYSKVVALFYDPTSPASVFQLLHPCQYFILATFMGESLCHCCSDLYSFND